MGLEKKILKRFNDQTFALGYECYVDIRPAKLESGHVHICMKCNPHS